MLKNSDLNEVLRKNVVLLSKQTEREVGMMPATVAPLPSVDQVKRIVTLVKSIIFPDYSTSVSPMKASVRTISVYIWRNWLRS